MSDIYESPLVTRYASKEMASLFSMQKRIETWRRLWLELARAEHALGLPITNAQINDLQAHLTDIDFACAEQREKEVRHDVMAHIYAYGKAALTARPLPPPRASCISALPAAMSPTTAI